MSERSEAVVFDLDGVLVDSERLIRCAWLDAAAEHGRTLPEELFRRVIGNNSAASRAILTELLGPDFPLQAVAARSRELVAAATRAGWPPKPHAAELLAALAAAEVPIAVASSTRREQVLARLETAGLAGHVDAVCGGDEVEHGKPAPDVYRAAAARIGVEAARCVAVEDTAYGAASAGAAGMRVLLVPDIVPAPEPLPDHVDATFDTLADAAAALRRHLRLS